MDGCGCKKETACNTNRKAKADQILCRLTFYPVSLYSFHALFCEFFFSFPFFLPPPSLPLVRRRNQSKLCKKTSRVILALLPCLCSLSLCHGHTNKGSLSLLSLASPQQGAMDDALLVAPINKNNPRLTPTFSHLVKISQMWHSTGHFHCPPVQGSPETSLHSSAPWFPGFPLLDCCPFSCTPTELLLQRPLLSLASITRLAQAAHHAAAARACNLQTDRPLKKKENK